MIYKHVLFTGLTSQFNRLKFAKNDWRSKLSDTSLSDQLTVMLESADIGNFDALPAVSLWNVKARRPREIVKTVVKPKIIDVEEEKEQEVVNVVANDVVQQQCSTEELDDYVSDDDYIDENDNDNDVELKATYNDRMVLANKMYKEFV